MATHQIAISTGIHVSDGQRLETQMSGTTVRNVCCNHDDSARVRGCVAGWGRAQETYGAYRDALQSILSRAAYSRNSCDPSTLVPMTAGESVYQISKMCAAYIRGLQGNHSKYLKIAATVKHYAFCE